MTKKVVFGWGRMNPPTINHEKLVNKVKEIAKTESAKPVLYLSHTHNAKKDPLTYTEKVHYSQKAFGIVQKSSATTIVEVMKELEQRGYTDVVFVAEEKRIREYTTLLNKYNGKEYNFDSIVVESAGDCDPDNGIIDVSVNLETFKRILPESIQPMGREIIDKLRDVLSVKETLTEEAKTIDEVLTIAQRRKRALMFKRLAPRIKRKRDIAMRRKASPEKIEKRARKAAIKQVKAKLSGGKKESELSISDKRRIETKIKQRQSIVNRIAKKLKPIVRKREVARMQARTKSEEIEYGNVEQKLLEKSEKSNISYDILEEVYYRGLYDWPENSTMNEDQYAFARVNSFIRGGYAAELDRDLYEGVFRLKDPKKSWSIRTNPYIIPVKKNSQGDWIPVTNNFNVREMFYSIVGSTSFPEFQRKGTESKAKTLGYEFQYPKNEALEWGTDEMRDKYSEDTPGQKPGVSVAEYGVSKPKVAAPTVKDYMKKKGKNNVK